MANAGCINAMSCDGCLIQTLQQLDSSNIGVGVQFTAPDPLDDKRLNYIKYTDKCGCTCCLTDENEILIYTTNGTIKNLTLTNKSTTKQVNVKRTDVFGTNRKKTVVRYKTGSYPTSITDGTLAVEELVKNQYSSTGYDVSGLSNSTNYYFTAFAVAQDDTIIDIKNQNIQTAFARQPDVSRTLLYMKFNNNLKDDSGNNHTVSGSGIGYGTIGNNHYVEKTATSYSNTYINPPTNLDQAIGSGDYTVSLFVYNVAHDGGAMAFGTWKESSPFYGIYILVGGDEVCALYNINNQFHTNSNLKAPLDKWTHIVFTRVSGVCYRFINGNLIDSYTDSPVVDFSQYVGNRFFLLNRSSYSGQSRGNATGGKISEVIFEKVGRSSQDVSDYFNYQKSNYGL